MELKVAKKSVSRYGGRREIRVEVPVETEILIPDYLPAVFKIIKCIMEPAVMQNSVEGGQWKGEGYLHCTVYYQSDEADARLYRTEVKFPFEKVAELPEGQYARGAAMLRGETEYCNCRAVSEHRIDLRGAYALRVELCPEEQLEVLTSLSDCGVEQRQEMLEATALIASEDKIVTTEGQINMPGAGESILEISGCYLPQEDTVREGQLECKGSLFVRIGYIMPGAVELLTKQVELPAEQAITYDAARPGDRCYSWGEIIACTMQAEDGDAARPTLAITWRLHTELWRPQRCKAVADAYSTICSTELEMVTASMLKIEDKISAAITAAADCELPSAEMTVCGCFARVSPPEAQGADGTVKLGGKGMAQVICADTHGELCCVDKPFRWELPGQWKGEGEKYLLHAAAYVKKATCRKDGAAARLEMEIAVNGVLLQSRSCTAAAGIELGEMLPNKSEGPALYLYFAAEGERVFDIAKRYHARAADLLAANHIEPPAEGDEQPTARGGCLLIPSAL